MFISFGIINKKILIPLFFPIFVKLRRLVRDSGYKSLTNPFSKVFCTFTSLSLSGFIYLFVLYKQKADQKKKENKIDQVKNLSNAYLLVKKNKGDDKEVISLTESDSEDPIEKEQKILKKKENRKKFVFTILIASLEMIATLIQDIWKKHDKKLNMEFRQTIGISFEYLYLLVFSIIFLKFQIYIHQIISLIIIYICLIIFFFETIFYKETSFKAIIFNILFFGSTQLFYCTENVFGKKYLITYFDNIYFYMFKIGIIGLIVLVPYDLIIEIFFDDKDTYHGIITFFRNLSESYEKIYLFVLDILFGFLWEISLWLTIYYFSPLHFIILELIGEFIETTFIVIDDDLVNREPLKLQQEITFYIVFPIIFFFVFVFFEILILNFCKLNYNTKIQIMLRQKVDGNYDVDKSGKLIPVNNGAQTTTILNYDEDYDDDYNNNDAMFQ
jgi:hypothetical protein